MVACKLCEERKVEIERILEAYQKDKKRYERIIKEREVFWFKMFWVGSGVSFLIGGLGIKILPIIIKIVENKLGA